MKETRMFKLGTNKCILKDCFSHSVYLMFNVKMVWYLLIRQLIHFVVSTVHLQRDSARMLFWLAVIFLIDFVSSCSCFTFGLDNCIALRLDRTWCMVSPPTPKPQQTKVPLLKYIKHQIWMKRDWLWKETWKMMETSIWRSCREVMKIQLCYSFTPFSCSLHYKREQIPPKIRKPKYPVPHCSKENLLWLVRTHCYTHI